jgi:crossover junction endodeoxyribonuclease RusA
MAVVVVKSTVQGRGKRLIMKIDLPYPPSSNRYWRSFRGRMVVSEEARTYKRVVGLIANHAGLQPGQGDVSVSIHIRRPAKRRDIDNHLKVTLDSLQGYMYENDGQIVELHAVMVDDKRNPGITVTVAPA